jgi:hypothetical protein
LTELVRTRLLRLLRIRLLGLLDLYYLGRYKRRTPYYATAEIFTGFRIVLILTNWFN